MQPTRKCTGYRALCAQIQTYSEKLMGSTALHSTDGRSPKMDYEEVQYPTVGTSQYDLNHQRVALELLDCFIRLFCSSRLFHCLLKVSS